MTQTSIAFCVAPRPITLKLLVPETSREQERGLQDFKINDWEGMIFLSDRWPEEQTISMWQASVPYPLAMLWVGPDNRIGALELVSPGDSQTYSHRGVAVIEINAHLVDRYDLDVGTVVVDGGVT